LYQRDDDKTEVIANRYDIYENSTAPLINFYKRQGILRTLDGSAGSENVFSEIIDILTA
jgi:adenylate kinase